MNIFDFRCKYCGGDLEEVKDLKSVGKCKYCGSKQTLPKLESEKRANLFERANHLRRNNEFDKAEALYEQLLNEDLTDPEAYWSLVLCHYGIEYVEDLRTKTRVPTINRLQYTSILADENYKSAIKYATPEQKELYVAEATAINEIQKGILDISRKEDPFDIFICYKETGENGKRTKDSAIAQELYHELTRDGYKVFFSRVTLQGKLGSAYEPYIFSALNSAKVMIVLGTQKEHFEAVWVRNEWSRFLGQIKKGEKKSLIPAYRDMDAYDLPVEFSHLQALDMSRLGFMQDLIDGVEKILKSCNKKDTPDQMSTPEHTQNVEPKTVASQPTIRQKPKKKKSKAAPIIITILILLGVGVAALFGSGVLNNSNKYDEDDSITDEKNTPEDMSAVEKETHIEIESKAETSTETDIETETVWEGNIETEISQTNNSRDTAKVIALKQEQCDSIDEETPDWYKFTTVDDYMVYRIEASSISKSVSQSYGSLYVILYSSVGIKLEEFDFMVYDTYSIDNCGSGYMDLYLDPNTEYFIKVVLENSDVLEYELCVTNLTIDAGTDEESATELVLDYMHTATMNSTLSDWYIFHVPESGNYICTIYNVDVGCAIDFLTDDGTSFFVENEDSYECYWYYLTKGESIYLEISPRGENPIANGTYIVEVKRK